MSTAGYDFVEGRAEVKGALCSRFTVREGDFHFRWLRNVLKVLRSDLKTDEITGTGAECSDAELLKIDGDAGAFESLVGRIPVHASSASRAKHICTNIRFGERGSSSIYSGVETDVSSRGSGPQKKRRPLEFDLRFVKTECADEISKGSPHRADA